MQILHVRLRKFRVRAYRCIHDSGEITVGDLAAFVGRNESGKTTILQALTLLNRDEKISELDLCDEMTEELKEEVKLAEGEFELNEYEMEILKEKFPGLPDIKKIKLFRTNRTPKVQYEFEGTEISDADDEGLNSWENFTKEILEFLDTVCDSLRKEFRVLRVSMGSHLMYIKEDCIVPHHLTFYELIVSKARGLTGPLFHFDVHDDVRLVGDLRIDRDDSHPGKIITSTWYSRNKHIFPASRWKYYQADADVSKM